MGLPQPSPAPITPSDDHLLERARTRDESAIRALTQRYNQRLFRIARGILRHDGDAEDAVQDAYVKAFTQLDHFRGDSAFATWLTRIVMNEALGRLRARRDTLTFSADREASLSAHILHFPDASRGRSPETTVAQHQLRELIERSIDALPDSFRLVFVARVVEGLSVEETATLFGLRPETVKTRVFRARARLRRELERRLGRDVAGAFSFDGARCDRLTESVLARLRALN